jgi:putative nucleotidyltransferase with HDIG domain
MISVEDARKLLDENISNRNMRKHMVAVSAIMKSLAGRFDRDEEPWMLTGLLHDIDYEGVGGDMSRHGLASAEILEGKLPEDCLHAIKAHNEETGVKAEGLLDKALIAADAVSGLIVASALVMPSKRLSEVRVETLEKKFRDRSFARSVKRDRVMVCEEVGLGFEEFLDISLRSLQAVSEDLGL